jgi:hypothetical protein
MSQHHPSVHPPSRHSLHKCAKAFSISNVVRATTTNKKDSDFSKDQKRSFLRRLDPSAADALGGWIPSLIPRRR